MIISYGYRVRSFLSQIITKSNEPFLLSYVKYSIHSFIKIKFNRKFKK